MPRYQFFTFPHNQKTDFTYLNMDTATFSEDKLALLAQNFELDGPPIDAVSAQAAVEKYQSDLQRPLEDYGRSSVIYVLVEGVLTWWRKRMSKSSS
ncbi:hypothetical protein [Photobacterium sp. TY1-4]|uniref:hypothetical protein n=1 Tax=Photobacterium sp. TY1-4 TaxID=2899122 RepID=UPI0021BFC00B|nr:hypothetical protein [Photobacterium sp. TY1-4]UXI03464.1 hypothetical protein NH461_23885 [Photobacterium sp. TY1-4]